MSGNTTPPLGSLLLTTLESVLEAAILVAGGYILTKKNALPRDSQKVISELNMNFFQPCLVASKIASSLTIDQLGDLWLPPVAFFVISFTSYWVAKGASRVMRLPPKQERFVIGCTIFQNSNSLPLALVSALAYSLDGLFWDQVPDDTDEAVASRGLLYLLVFSQMGLAIRWSWGYNYLFARSLPSDYEHDDQGSIESGETLNSEDEDADEGTSLLNGHQQSDTRRAGAQVTKRTTPKDWKHTLSRPFVAVWNSMNIPLWSMLISLIIACIPALQRFFFTKDTFVYNSLTTAIITSGNCAVPLILVVLGGNLASKQPENSEELSDRRKTVFTAITSRMLLVPLVLLPIITILARFAPVSVVDDPIFLVVMFILIGSPTAIQVSSMCQLNDVFEKEIAMICWYSYALLTIPSTLLLVVLALKTVDLNRLGPWTVEPGSSLIHQFLR
ncbi:hypothetical protein PYCC9005_000901 [Savitreella phatthalungensis]